MMHDDIIEEIHADRVALSERFGGDMAVIVHYCQSLHPPIPVNKAKPQRRARSQVSLKLVKMLPSPRATGRFSFFAKSEQEAVMLKTRIYKSNINAAIHQTARDL